MKWKNPTPVSVLLVPVNDPITGRVGILIGERGINPQKGLYGLPGGFVDPSDPTLEYAALRELQEETGLSVNIENISLFSSYSDTRCMLAFNRSNQILFLQQVEEDFVPCHECPAVRVAWEPEKLCFTSHTEALAKWFRWAETPEFMR